MHNPVSSSCQIPQENVPRKPRKRFFFSEDSTTIKVRTLGFLRLYNGNAQSERDDPFRN